MAPTKKNAAQELADALADFGPAALILYDPSPELVAGLTFHRDRILLRQMGRLAMAIAMGISGEFPREVFLALADSQEQGEREFRRYQAHARMNHAFGAIRETL